MVEIRVVLKILIGRVLYMLKYVGAMIRMLRESSLIWFWIFIKRSSGDYKQPINEHPKGWIEKLILRRLSAGWKVIIGILH